MLDKKFIHLNIHSEYSIVDSIVKIDQLSEKAQQYNYESIAITDSANLFGFLKFYKSVRSKGIKPIAGAEINHVRDSASHNEHANLTLIAKNQLGYKNLIKLISKSQIVGKTSGIPVIETEWLAEHSDGLIALSGGFRGHIGKAVLDTNHDLFLKRINYFQKVFKEDFILEISRINRPQEDIYNDYILSKAGELGLPVVASNEVRFIDKEDYEAHETRVCIQKGEVLSDARRTRSYFEDQYFLSPEEMYEKFKDIPEVLSNAYELGKKCNLEIETGIYVLPDFKTPLNKSAADHLIEISKNNLKEKTKDLSDDGKVKYADRLDFELDVISKMGYSGYFLVVSDFVNWAQENNVPVGPGRGSGAASLVAYCLGITGIDPLKYGLLFERFLNPDRISNPDFDIDFCKDGRDKVIDYVTQKYGKAAVAQICTFGTMAARAVVRDVARAQGKSYGLADRLAKMIPFSPDMTLEKALGNNDLKRALKTDEQAEEIFDMARKLEGIIRNVGKHAAGVVIAPSEINDFSPLYLDEATNTLATQFDMKDIESVGLQKFDFLGLRTLTIIKDALDLINTKREKLNLDAIDLEEIDLEDRLTFDLLQNGLTTAVFQLESRGLKEYLVKIKPSSFEDIISVVALYRPGPLDAGMVDTFIKRKHGSEKTDYLGDKDIEKVLQNTYGVIVYQEQVMQLAQEYSGFSLGQADLLRRAMGKKIPEEMERQRPEFIKGALKKGKIERAAEGLFDQIQTFAGYGFNKAHSAGYGLIAFQTAWLKAHYPVEFLSAALSSDMDDSDRVRLLLDDCKNFEIDILKPDVNKSQLNFVNQGDNEILYGLGAVKGLGKAAIENIISEREQKPFENLYDFCARVDLSKVDKRGIEPLIKCGAMDSFNLSRKEMLESLEDAMKYAKQNTMTQESGISDLFGGISESNDFIPVKKDKYDEFANSKFEFSALGFYLETHPVKEHYWELKKLGTGSIENVTEERVNTISGVIIRQNRIQTRRGPLVFATLDDGTDRIELVISSEVLDSFEGNLNPQTIYIASGDVTFEKDAQKKNIGLQKKMRVTDIKSLEEARMKSVTKLKINIEGQEKKDVLDIVENLKAIALIENNTQGSQIEMQYNLNSGSANIELDKDFRILLNDDNMDKLVENCGKENIDFQYRAR
jgi:DNA polymerase-3 subunit alpha